MKREKKIVLGLVAACVLVACGQKGPLKPPQPENSLNQKLPSKSQLMDKNYAN